MYRFVSTRLLVLVTVLLLVQYVLAPFSLAWGGRVDLLYLVILDYAFFESWEMLPFFALLMGLVRDLLGGHLFGIETACLTVTGVGLSFGIRKLERNNPWVQGVMSFLFVGLTEALSLVVGRWLTGPKTFSFYLAQNVLLTTCYTVLWSPAFFWFANRWFKRTTFLKQYELF